MTSATDELRRLLTEAGVEWGNIRNDGSESDYLTEWQFDGIEGHAIATEWAVGRLTVCIAHPMTPEQAIAATLGPCNDSCNCTNGERTDLAAENAMLREQMERLVTLLRNDCDIDASWDGLRRFWSIGLTEGGCLMRDRACKAEAENAKLRQQLADVTESMGRVEERCAKLRELVRDVNRAAHMLCEAWEGSCSKEAEGMSLHAVCPISDTNELCVFGKLYERMRELGVES